MVEEGGGGRDVRIASIGGCGIYKHSTVSVQCIVSTFISGRRSGEQENELLLFYTGLKMDPFPSHFCSMQQIVYHVLCDVGLTISDAVSR